MRFLWIEFVESVRIAFSAVWANKLRALLTTLGIIIGITTVTTMFTVINGIERSFDRSVEMLGTNVLNVKRVDDGFNVDWWVFRSRPPIREELADYIAERRPRHVEAVAPVAYSGQSVDYNGERLRGVFVRASTPALADINGFGLTQGRFFDDIEFRTARTVAVIGQDVAERLFPIESPIGKRIRIGGQRFEVIGVLEKQGKFLGLISFDEQIIIPLSAFTRSFAEDPYLEIQVKVDEARNLDLVQGELTGVVRAARRLDAMESDNFSIQRQDAFDTQLQPVRVAIYGVGVFLTALSLLVGGIGVMNIMFVSVKERTREIGVRKALGAPRRAILTQFLVEAIVVCLIGGVIGILLAFVIAHFIEQVFTAYLAPGTVVLAFGICVMVGLIAGLLPALTASRANPIEALRYE